MIGFQQALQAEKTMQAEQPETINLDKKELFDLLAHKYFLPPYQSRGVTRDYLLGVYRGEYFRVGLVELKHFEVDLTAAMIKRVGVLNNALLVKKLNLLQESRGQPQLGFDIFEPPDQVGFREQGWLYRVARFVDKSNLLEFFEEAVVEEPALTSTSSNISVLYQGRVRASSWLFRIEAARKNRKLWDALRLLSDTYRHYLSQQILLAVLSQEMQVAERRKSELAGQLDDLITKTALSYTTLENSRIRPEAIIGASQEVTPEIREAVHTNCRL